MYINVKDEQNIFLKYIKSILRSNSQMYKKRIHKTAYYPENDFVSNYYNYLVDINNNQFYNEVMQFNNIRNLYLQSYTGEIEIENKYFQPFEYLPFEESKSFKEFYNQHKQNMDIIFNLFN